MTMPVWLTWKAVAGAAKLALGLIGGIRAAIFLAFALYFALMANVWQGKYDRLNDKLKAAETKAQVLATRLAIARAKVTERVVTRYVDRVKVVEGRTRTIIKEIPVYVPASTPALPGGLRVLLDAASLGILPDAARIADAAPVPAQDLASSVIDNYGTCHANAEQVTALQDWIRQQQAVK